MRPVRDSIRITSPLRRRSFKRMTLCLPRSARSIWILIRRSQVRCLPSLLQTLAPANSRPAKMRRFVASNRSFRFAVNPQVGLVGVRFATHDARLSADVVNSLMRILVERNFEERNQAIAESSMWLSRQLDDIRDKMEDANHALADFGAKTGIADVDPEFQHLRRENGRPQ